MAHLSGSARARFVRRMFGEIVASYDRMNAIMTFGRYRTWQQLAAEIAAPAATERGLDVASGTGDIAIDLAAFVPQVVGLDFSRPMLLAAGPKIRASGRAVFRVEGDALNLPFRDESFDCATVGFGIRNVSDVEHAIREMARVVRPGGRVVCLELTRPWLPGFRSLFRVYLHGIVPLVGGLVSGRPFAYRYLGESLDRFPDAEALRDIFAGCGLAFPDYRLLNLGTLAIHWGTKRFP